MTEELKAPEGQKVVELVSPIVASFETLSKAEMIVACLAMLKTLLATNNVVDYAVNFDGPTGIIDLVFKATQSEPFVYLPIKNFQESIQ